MKRCGGLLALLTLVGVVHGLIIWRSPAPVLFGDEGEYLQRAFEDAERGDTSLLPGRLRFDWRPELASRFYSRFAGRYLSGADVLRRVSVAHLGMLLAILALTYGQARWLGLRAASSLFACALLGGFPWLGFYVHALWPEILHAFATAVALFCLQGYFVSWRRAWLVPAGVALGYALFAKASLNLFVPVIAAYLGVASFAHFRSASPGASPWLRSAAAVAVLVATLSLVLGPQLVRNARAGNGLRLASNRWINLELGLMREAGPPERRGEIYRRYQHAAGSRAEREERSRQRTLEYLRANPLSAIAAAQARKLALLLARKRSFLEFALYGERWGSDPPGWLPAVAWIGRGMWYAICVLGTLGALLVGLRSPGWGLLALLLAYFAAALFAIPLKPRFAMPAVPVLCLFSGAAFERACDVVVGLRRRARDARA